MSETAASAIPMSDSAAWRNNHEVADRFHARVGGQHEERRADQPQGPALAVVGHATELPDHDRRWRRTVLIRG
jgi:hypothetical protein